MLCYATAVTLGNTACLFALSGLTPPVSPSSFMGSGKKFPSYRITKKSQIGVWSGLGLLGEMFLRSRGYC